MIDLRMDKKQLERTVERAKERNIIIPTFAQMKNPDLIPDSVKEELKNIGLVGYYFPQPVPDHLEK